jgi:hypothetical protein
MNACCEITIGSADIYSEDVLTFTSHFATRSADVTRQSNHFTVRSESLALELRLNADRFFSSLDTEERDAESR